MRNVLPIRIMFFIFIAALSLRVSITSVGPVLEIIVHELKLSRAMASLIVTIPVACMGICGLLAAPFSKKFGLERTIAFCLLLLSFATYIRTFNHSIYLLGLGSILLGASIAIAGPLISGFVKRYATGHISKGMILYSLGISFSGMLGTFITLPLMHYTGLDWSVVLQFWAAPIFIIGSIWMLFFAKTSATEVKEISVKLPWKSRRAWLLSIAFGLQSGNFYSLLSWLMPYLMTHEFSMKDANHFLNIFMLTAPIGSICFPLLLAKFDRQWVVFSCSSLTALALFSLAISPYFLTYVMISVLGACVSGMFILMLNLAFYEAEDANAVASWTAMILSIGYLFSAIIPTLFGLLKDITQSFQSVMWGLLIATLTMVILLWRLTGEIFPSNS